MAKKGKRPADLNQLAKLIVDTATDQSRDRDGKLIERSDKRSTGSSSPKEKK